MSTKEIEKIDLLVQIKEKKLTQAKVADILGLSIRQVRRLFKAYKTLGAQGIISKKRGKASNHQLPQVLKEWITATIREKYFDFWPTLACEKLNEVHKIKVSIGTIRKLMIKEGFWVDKKIKEVIANPHELHSQISMKIVMKN